MKSVVYRSIKFINEDFKQNANFIYEDFKQNPNSKPATSMEPPVIDKSFASVCLMEPARETLCHVGLVEFFSFLMIFLTLEIRMGRGTNVFAELQVILNLLKRASVNGIGRLQVFEDFKLVAWLKGNYRLQNSSLRALLERTVLTTR